MGLVDSLPVTETDMHKLPTTLVLHTSRFRSSFYQRLKAVMLTLRKGAGLQLMKKLNITVAELG